MGQIRVLLWKNFVWCLRHPIKTLFFYLLPLLCSCFILLTLAITGDRVGDCDFESFALPPSHHMYLLASMACNREKGCANQQEDYQPYYRIFDDFYERHKRNKSSLLCPGISLEDFNLTSFRVLKSCLIDRKADATLGDYSYEDLVNVGQIMYYPKSEETDKIFEAVARRTDNMEGGFPSVASSGTDEIAERMKETREEMADLTHLTVVKLAQEHFKMGMCFKKIKDRAIGFQNRSAALQHLRAINLTQTAPWAILEFNETGPSFTYKIITHLGQRHRKSTLILQSLIDSAVIELRTDKRPKVHLEMKTLPRRCHKNEFLLASANQTVGLVITLGMVVLAQTIVSEVSSERTSGLLDFLIIAGVPKWKVRLSWIVFGLVFCLSTMTLIAGFFYLISPVMLDRTPFSLVLFVSLVYGISFLFFCLAIANLMPTAQRASIIILVLLFVTYLVPRWSILIQAIGYTGRKALMVRGLSFLFGPIAIQIIYAYIFLGERDARPVGWHNLFESSALEPDEISGPGEILMIMLVQICMYILLSTGLVPWLTSIKCRGRLGKKHSEEDGAVELPVIEPLISGKEKEVGVKIEDLVKVYSSNRKVAVDNLSVSFYKNQITAMLGHNGAGKSTTMNILTGMMEATSGTAVINGKDICRDMVEIRKNLGFCPQHDIVYSDLTVAEHLWFYGSLRGMPEEEVASYSDQILTEMQLGTERDKKTLSRNLSGGNKRKLSIAVAFLGDPETVVLDEPTSAIDPFSRRAIWDVILRYRTKSTLLISTHYMQEADLLGDRIAIIDQGQLKCFGSPMFLKAKYGSGSFIKAAHEVAFDHESMETNLRRFVPASIAQKGANQSSFSVPISAVRSSEMVDALEWIENSSSELGINSFGLSESTMEQVFFNVTSEAIEHGATNVIPEKDNYVNNPLWNTQLDHISGVKLHALQFIATLEKRWNLIKRSKTAFIFQVLLPLVFTALMLFFVNIMTDRQLPREEQEMNIWSSNIEQPQIAFFGEKSQLLQSILANGLGAQCNGTLAKGKECGPQAEFPANLNYKESVNCDCSDCPAGAAGPSAPRVELPSREYLLNLNERNLTAYLLKTSDEGIIGAIEVGGQFATLDVSTLEDEVKNNSGGFDKDYTDYYTGDYDLGYEVDDSPKLPSFFGFYKTGVEALAKAMTEKGTEIHTLWVYTDVPYNEGAPFARESVRLQIPLLNAYTNALLRSLTKAESESYSIRMYTEEINFGGTETDPSGTGFRPTTGGILGMFSGLALLMPIFSTAVVIVNERSSGNKQLQMSMGLNRSIYWLANFLWDSVLYMVSLAIMMLFMLAFPDTFNQDMSSYALIAMLYGLGMLLLSYWLSFVFETGRNCITAVGNIAPFFSFASFILMIFKRKDWYENLNNRLLLFPPYFITETITILDFNQKFPFPRDIYTWEMLGKRFAACLLFSLLMFVLLLLSELKVFQLLTGAIRGLWYRKATDCFTQEKDPDVVREEVEVLNDVEQSRVLKAERVVKFYPKGKKLAVAGVSFGIRKGECFGLLGTNGAGKTTLFKMLSAFLAPSRGHCSILGHRLDKHPSFVSKHIGYCPQEDILFERLTPGEHLQLYGKIKGIAGHQRASLISTLIQEVGLGPHKTKNAEELSGGNKRKLNFAISIQDFPDLIFLDEMTTGLDPEARRAAWNLLGLAVKRGCSAVITSHSMEECEALCDRLVIMVNGQFKCIGGVQYLKDKYGNNYTIKFKLAVNSNPDALFAEIGRTFSGMTLIEQHIGYLEVEIPASSLKLSALFRTIQSLKDQYQIDEFSVSQTTLEHVFVNMVKDQS